MKFKLKPRIQLGKINTQIGLILTYYYEIPK